mmetsp:Transcript_35022/g.56028  ORF Transcript_35022/g.56028 Transcript_35022/m.56028 type:complete len:793 (-) Transcript_35022:42-2420(-)
MKKRTFYAGGNKAATIAVSRDGEKVRVRTHPVGLEKRKSDDLRLDDLDSSSFEEIEKQRIHKKQHVLKETIKTESLGPDVEKAREEWSHIFGTPATNVDSEYDTKYRAPPASSYRDKPVQSVPKDRLEWWPAGKGDTSWSQHEFFQDKSLGHKRHVPTSLSMESRGSPWKGKTLSTCSEYDAKFKPPPVVWEAASKAKTKNVTESSVDLSFDPNASTRKAPSDAEIEDLRKAFVEEMSHIHRVDLAPDYRTVNDVSFVDPGLLDKEKNLHKKAVDMNQDPSEHEIAFRPHDRSDLERMSSMNPAGIASSRSETRGGKARPAVNPGQNMEPPYRETDEPLPDGNRRLSEYQSVFQPKHSTTCEKVEYVHQMYGEVPYGTVENDREFSTEYSKSFSCQKAENQVESKRAPLFFQTASEKTPKTEYQEQFSPRKSATKSRKCRRDGAFRTEYQEQFQKRTNCQGLPNTSYQNQFKQSKENQEESNGEVCKENEYQKSFAPYKENQQESVEQIPSETNDEGHEPTPYQKSFAPFKENQEETYNPPKSTYQSEFQVPETKTKSSCDPPKCEERYPPTEYSCHFNGKGKRCAPALPTERKFIAPVKGFVSEYEGVYDGYDREKRKEFESAIRMENAKKDALRPAYSFAPGKNYHKHNLFRSEINPGFVPKTEYMQQFSVPKSKTIQGKLEKAAETFKLDTSSPTNTRQPSQPPHIHPVQDNEEQPQRGGKKRQPGMLSHEDYLDIAHKGSLEWWKKEGARASREENPLTRNPRHKPFDNLFKTPKTESQRAFAMPHKS